MDKTTRDQSGRDKVATSTAVQAGPPKSVPTLVNGSDSISTSWPFAAQSVAACLFIGVLTLLAMDRIINRNHLRPTSQITTKRIDVNRATRSQLLQIPGVGPRLADNIVEHRRRFGPIESINDLEKIDGIGVKSAVRLQKWLQINGNAKPATLVAPGNKSSNKRININTATASELQALQRIGPTLSKRIVAERAKQPFSSVDDLIRVYGIGSKTVERLRPYVAVK